MAIIYNNDISVRTHPLSDSIHPSLFEFQLVKVTFAAKSVTPINIYQPTSHALSSAFFDELSDTTGAVVAGTIDYSCVATSTAPDLSVQR